MIEYEEVQKKIEEMDEKDMTMEEILEIVDMVNQNKDVTITDMARVMKNVLYSGDAQDLFKFSRDQVRKWKEKVRWACHEWEDKEEVKGLMMEFKKEFKVKVDEALETEEKRVGLRCNK